MTNCAVGPLELGKRYECCLPTNGVEIVYQDERSTFFKTAEGELRGCVTCGPPYTLPSMEMGYPVGTFFMRPDQLVWKPTHEYSHAEWDTLQAATHPLEKTKWHLLIHRNDGAYQYVGAGRFGAANGGAYGCHIHTYLANPIPRDLWMELSGNREWILTLTGWPFAGNTEEALHYASMARNPKTMWESIPENIGSTFFSLRADNYDGSSMFLTTTGPNEVSMAALHNGVQWCSTNRTDGGFDETKYHFMGEEFNMLFDSIIDAETAIKMFEGFLSSRSTEGWHRLGIDLRYWS